MPTIEKLQGMEILDSRGRPTVACGCWIEDGPAGGVWASVPSGTSTGRAEAVERRDGDPKRYRGLGCRIAASNITELLSDAATGKTFDTQSALDEFLLTQDGTPDKSVLGANALLAVSLAYARATAIEADLPLYQHLAAIVGQPPHRLPRLTVNLFSGGKHAGGQVPIQDVLLVPLSTKTIDESLVMTAAVYQSALKLTAEKYNTRGLVADEGGLAPPFANSKAMLDDAVAAIEAAGLSPGKDIALAVDLASSHFYSNGKYTLSPNDILDGPGMIARLTEWVNRYPIISVEDGLAEDDWQHWPALRAALGGKALVLGDDFLCTNPTRIARAIKENCATALLLKVNQIGTLTEAATALRLATEAGWQVTISARSGETEDDWLADLATGWAADQIKVGSITRSERLAKYNRLLMIESQTDLPLPAWR
ncbi:MAG TPA: phosphopyruvate hydratase [Tepidisphaeraceae bacterium]|jgi:enolase|nr:phosphopyruvate hydratase [Tepidisphaeraceae bacterium]